MNCTQTQHTALNTNSLAWLAAHDVDYDENCDYFNEEEKYALLPDVHFSVQQEYEKDTRPAVNPDQGKMSDWQRECDKDRRRKKAKPVIIVESSTVDDDGDDDQPLDIACLVGEHQAYLLSSIQKYGHGKNLDVALFLLQKTSIENIAREIGRCTKTVKNAIIEIKERVAENVMRIDADAAECILNAGVQQRKINHAGRPRKIEPDGQLCLFDFVSEKQKQVYHKRQSKPENTAIHQLSLAQWEVAA
jgi:hypothetical protein